MPGDRTVALLFDQPTLLVARQAVVALISIPIAALILIAIVIAIVPLAVAGITAVATSVLRKQLRLVQGLLAHVGVALEGLAALLCQSPASLVALPRLLLEALALIAALTHPFRIGMANLRLAPLVFETPGSGIALRYGLRAGDRARFRTLPDGIATILTLQPPHPLPRDDTLDGRLWTFRLRLLLFLAGGFVRRRLLVLFALFLARATVVPVLGSILRARECG